MRRQLLASVIASTLLSKSAFADSLSDLKKIVAIQKAMMDSVVPVGTVISFAGKEVPTGWLVAEGQLLPISKYPLLAATIGATYCTVSHGGSCAEGNFRLPDLRGRTVAGMENNSSRLTESIDSRGLGNTGGAAVTKAAITISTQPEFVSPQFEESYFTKTVVNGELNYNIGGYYSYGAVAGNRGAAPGIDFAVSLGHSHPFTVKIPERSMLRTRDAAAEMTPTNNVQPTVVLLYLIRAN